MIDLLARYNPCIQLPLLWDMDSHVTHQAIDVRHENQQPLLVTSYQSRPNSKLWFHFDSRQYPEQVNSRRSSAQAAHMVAGAPFQSCECRIVLHCIPAICKSSNSSKSTSVMVMVTVIGSCI
jgi:hypothetical protein